MDIIETKLILTCGICNGIVFSDSSLRQRGLPSLSEGKSYNLIGMITSGIIGESGDSFFAPVVASRATKALSKHWKEEHKDHMTKLTYASQVSTSLIQSKLELGETMGVE